LVSGELQVMASTGKQIQRAREAGDGSKIALPATILHNKELLFNRELSWLEFNRRVLEEALDESQPLLERLKFLSIFSTNLDEFFMIRVSGLMEEMEDEIIEPSPDGMTPAEQLQEISRLLHPMIEEQMRCVREEVLPRLKDEGIRLLSHSELSEKEQREVDKYFIDNVFPILTPQAVDTGHPFPYISNLSLNVGVMVKATERSEPAPTPLLKGDPRFARIKVPPTVSPLVPVGDSGSSFIYLGSLISANLCHLFPGMRTGKSNLFRVTRDADIELREDEAGDLLRTMEQHLRRRRFGMAVRLEVSSSMPAKMVKYLTNSLELAEDDVYVVDGPVDIPGLMTLYQMDRPDLKDKPFQPVLPSVLQQGKTIFDTIKQQDVLLHHPYTSYNAVTDFINAAAADDNVLAIKICLYRTGQHSPIVRALMEASERGKQVTALVELKARFDEENNIVWARQLERAGVHVVYGLLGLKTHCKVALVVRREGKHLRRYVHVATGNYNPMTSRIYTDLGLFTADPEIGADATDLFNFLTGYSWQDKYRQLMVAPLHLRERMMALIKRETKHARHGKDARIIVKVNSITDTEIIRALYEASQAGVKVDLIVRGVCMLRPGVPGISDNIQVISIVGRFLEHSRIFYFANNGEDEAYIGSADWMHRNLSRRVEVVTPIKDEKIKRYLKEEILEVYLRDNVKARRLLPDGTYKRVRPAKGEETLDSQMHFVGRVNVND
jgi:polyphosphate kinase